ncbi:unnamed protein product [Effrenium voratum]|nr:unnamed protein product [Effrenium voratum]
MLSFLGRCFTYDKTADGYLRGEGVAGIFLELQEYSKEAFAAMPASQANQDGKSASITAPNGPSQEKCIKACFREAKYLPSEVDCFETHGTGTALGDPIEVGAFRRIYVQSPRVQPLLVTSSKTNLGHLEGCAGMAGFIKCALQVMRCECSPNIHLRERNPHLETEGFPAQFVSEGMVTQYNSCVSGVSSFGFGGTNAHAMAFGQNICTSRDVTRKDFRGLMIQRINQALEAKLKAALELGPDYRKSLNLRELDLFDMQALVLLFRSMVVVVGTSDEVAEMLLTLLAWSQNEFTTYQRRVLKTSAIAFRRLHPDLSRRLSRENREALQFFEKTQVKVNTTESRWMVEVKQTLRKMDITVELKPLIDDQVLDMYLPVSKAVVCAVGPYSYYAGTTNRTAYSKLHQKVLELEGYTCMPVPYFEWSELKTEEDKMVYLWSLGRKAAGRNKKVKVSADAHPADVTDFEQSDLLDIGAQ